MTQVRRTLSWSRELDVNLNVLARKRHESLSALLEMLLREHPLVNREVEQGRLEDSIEDFGLVPSTRSPMRAIMEARMKEADASGEGSPKTRKRGASQP
jgi:hypothetical protein